MDEQELKKIKEEFYQRFEGANNDKDSAISSKTCEAIFDFIEAQLKKQRQEGYNDCIKHRIDDFNNNLKSRDLAEKYDAKHNTKKN